MLTKNSPAAAYQSTLRSTETPRSLEYQAFATVTAALAAPRAQGIDGLKHKLEAVNLNLTLWHMIAVDVAHPGNALPAELRARVFYLAEFVRNHSSKVISGEGEVDALVEINTSIMRGLRGDTGEADGTGDSALEASAQTAVA